MHTLHLFVCLQFLPPCLLLPHFLCLCLTAGVFLKNNKVWGRACACVFCAGLTDWMGWLHWAGFLCGPLANFMIYSAKGRGARPPVTTEREPHVGLMISPQKCLLWPGLCGAQSPPAWVPECWREEGGGHLKRRARLTGLSQCKRLPLHIYIYVGAGGVLRKERTDRKCHVQTFLHPRRSAYV